MNAPDRPRIIMATAIYPPDGRVGGLRPAKLAKRFIERGFAVDVVTSSLTGAVSGQGAFGEHVHVVNPRPTLRDWYLDHRRRTGATTPTQPDGALAAALGPLPRSRAFVEANLRSLLTVPDLERGIIWPMAARLRELLRHEPALLYSTSPPHSTQLAARLAVAGTSTPWIAEFRDPWSEPDHRRPPRHTATRRVIDGWLEGTVLRRADGLVAVSDGIADWLRVRAPTTPIVTSRNGIDHVTTSARRSFQPGQPVNALYLGELYLGRDPTPLFAALETLISGGRVSSTDIRCDFVGDVMTYRDTPTAQLVANHGLNDVVTLAGRVPRADALRLQDASDLQILFAQDQPRQVPNKLYEYLGTRRPILAFADDHGETARLLRDVGGHFIVTGKESPVEVAATVEAAVRMAATGVCAGSIERLGPLRSLPQLDRVADLVDKVWRSKLDRCHRMPTTSGRGATTSP